jgi:nucleotide-binding universal stress UspA family protein
MTNTSIMQPDESPEECEALRLLPNDRQRAFVIALFSEEAPVNGDGLFVFAARQAGYGAADGSSTNKSLSVIANRLVHDARVQRAIALFSRSTLRAISPEAIRALKQVIRDPKHRDHMRAIAAVADRISPLQTNHAVVVEHRTPVEMERATKEVLEKIDALARSVGLTLPPPIDAEFVVVPEGAS